MKYKKVILFPGQENELVLTEVSVIPHNIIDGMVIVSGKRKIEESIRSEREFPEKHKVMERAWYNPFRYFIGKEYSLAVGYDIPDEWEVYSSYFSGGFDLDIEYEYVKYKIVKYKTIVSSSNIEIRD